MKGNFIYKGNKIDYKMENESPFISFLVAILKIYIGEKIGPIVLKLSQLFEE